MTAPARDFSNWLQHGKDSNVTLRIVLETEPQRQGSADGAAESASAAAAAPRKQQRSASAASWRSLPHTA